jgi:TatD DNase family protein
MIEYFDSHTHLQFPIYNKERKNLIEKTLQGGVGFVDVGTNKKTSEEALILALEYEHQPIYAAVGLHPIHTHKNNFLDKNELSSGESFEEFDYALYKKLAENKKVVAIGECGLDYYRIKDNDLEIKKKQRKVFEEQIKLSIEVKKPLMIHCRNAYQDLFSIIQSFKSMLPETPGIVHFFAGTKEDAQKFLELGFYFTFGGVITLTRDYDEVVKFIPKDKILLETDAPYVAPKTNRGKTNEPLFIKETYERAGEIKNISLDTLKNQVLENNEKVFRIGLPKQTL